MPLDGMTLHFVKEELRNTILGSRVEKIHQPSRQELVLHLRSRTQASRLLFCVSANSPRVHLTERPPENPATPPMFCMLARKHLGGATLIDIRQLGLDRVLFFDFSGTNDLGDKTRLTICLELMAKHSNLILCREDGNILDALKRVDDAQSSVREILPGLPYQTPPQQKKYNLLEIPIPDIVEKIAAHPEKTCSAALLATLQGASPLLCRELAERAGGMDIAVKNSSAAILSKVLGSLQQTLQNADATAWMLQDGVGKPIDFSFFEIKQYGALYHRRAYERFSLLLDRFYAERDRLDRTRQRAADLLKLLNNTSARIAKKLASQRAELQASTERETLRIWAELLMANQYQLEKGALFYEVKNYYDENQTLRIPANPALSPTANAQKYYKDYRKAKTAEEKLTQLIAAAEDDLQYLETVTDALTRASASAEIQAIRAELSQAGFLKARKETKRQKEKPLPPLEYRSSDGFLIYVGRNNIQNDQLSLRQAHKTDLWLHTQNYPGSHVIVASQGEEVPEQTIREAAQLAAWHSKARESAQVPVDYTAARHLKKPNGAKPGKVIYHVYQTVWVTPKNPEPIQ